MLKTLTECQLVLKTYGKQADDLEKIFKVFVKYLAEYAPDKIIKALQVHIKTSSDFPTPSDIVKIIDGKCDGKDKPNHALYQEICSKRRNGEHLNYFEEAYKKKYEAFYLTD